jgi:hypothetical protein
VWKPSPTGLGFIKSPGGTTFTSFVNGKTDPGALNIEFDFPVYGYDQPQGQALIRVWGIGLGMIGQAANLNGQNFILRAGMQKGLPLANPLQAGIIAQGSIFQCFGNWSGVNQSLDLIIYPGAAGPQDIAFVWPPGVPLNVSLRAALSQIKPAYALNVDNISPNLRQLSLEAGHYDSLQTFADHVQQISEKIGKPIYGADYDGVKLTIVGSTIYASDGTGTARIVPIEFRDMIGQPTWLEPAKVSFKCVLRSDINVTDLIKFPAEIQLPYALTSVGAVTGSATGVPASTKSAFQGTFEVTEMHHFANLRQPDAESWNTSFVAVAT